MEWFTEAYNKPIFEFIHLKLEEAHFQTPVKCSMVLPDTLLSDLLDPSQTLIVVFGEFLPAA